MEGRASRGQEKEGPVRAAPAYDQRAVKLASSVRRDERFPLWVRSIRPGRLAALLTRKALAGWDVDDVYGALEEWRIGGKRLLARPDNPPGYLWSILNAIPDDVPPARLDRAREVAITEAEHAAWRRELEEMRQARMRAAAGMNAAARQVRDSLAERAAGRGVVYARARETARRELADADGAHGVTR
ncbi:hypothetical protein [Nocardia wallacei]|uniref:hypothetical protein n=1 Tax=Nocardia wallacei TaxID=480035 RepID=UPI002455C1AF|nr:hypothetical protein [Nocardia wallacei]